MIVVNGSSSRGLVERGRRRVLDGVAERLEQARRVVGRGDAGGIGRRDRGRGVRCGSPMRSLPGSAPTSSAYGRAGGGAVYGVAGHVALEHVEHAPRCRARCASRRGASTSPRPALRSRRDRARRGRATASGRRARTCSPGCGSIRRRRPRARPGPCRSRPRPRSRRSNRRACASVSHGLRVGPYACGSVVGISPSSGVFVLPTITKPAVRASANR